MLYGPTEIDERYVDGFPALYSTKDELVDNPRFVVFIDTHEDLKYGARDILEQINELVEFLMCKNTGCSMRAAREKCLEAQPLVTIEDQKEGVTSVYQYLRTH